MGNSPVPPSWSHGHLRWRPLPPEAPAPASFLRKLGSPWQRDCPWGGPLGSVPRSSADIRDSAPPAGTCASPGRRERLRGGVREEGEGEARQNLGPGRPGRPRRSCSLQQVRRTRARPVAEPPPPPPAQVGRGDPSRRPGAAGLRRAASSGPPSFSRSARPPPALPGRGGGPLAPSRFSTTSGTAPAPGGVPFPGSPVPPGPAPPFVGSGSGITAAEDGPRPRGGCSPQLLPAGRFLTSLEQSRGAGASGVPWGWEDAPMGDFGFP